MSDAATRALERQARADDGDVQARARVLRDRVRRGELTQEHLELAAYCGDEAARLACPRYPVPVNEHTLPPGTRTVLPPEAQPFDLWARGLEHWGSKVGVRAAVAAGRAVHAVRSKRLHTCYEHCDACSVWRTVGATLEAAEAWLACPCEEHREDCLRLLLAGSGSLPEFAWSTLDSIANGELSQSIHAVKITAGLAGESTVRAAIQQALITWALGDAP